MRPRAFDLAIQTIPFEFAALHLAVLRFDREEAKRREIRESMAEEIQLMARCIYRGR